MPPRLATAFAAALLVAACQPSSSSSASSDHADAPLAGAAIGGPFTLQDKDGKIVHWSDFDGKYRIVYFGYTYCPDVCPLDVSKMMQGYALFKKESPETAARIQPLFVSIDPERDTPEKVGEFASAFSDDLIGLTGTPDQVKQAAEAFKVFYQKGEDAGNGSYLMDHSRAAYLMGPDGQPISLLPVDDSPAAVAAELKKWTA